MTDDGGVAEFCAAALLADEAEVLVAGKDELTEGMARFNDDKVVIVEEFAFLCISFCLFEQLGVTPCITAGKAKTLFVCKRSGEIGRLSNPCTVIRACAFGRRGI
ncbi:hypothetical protein [Caballeronia sp.]|uniref:hypothetical protein n=1 Tax=Caballeronia sp. TaxID=1931223 RepID=UPI003C355D94